MRGVTRRGILKAGALGVGWALGRRSAGVSILRKSVDVKVRPDLVDPQAPKGVEILQLTTDREVPSTNVYMEAQIFTPDSKRFVFHRSANAHESDPTDPRHQYVLCDLEDHFAMHPLTTELGATGPS